MASTMNTIDGINYIRQDQLGYDKDSRFMIRVRVTDGDETRIYSKKCADWFYTNETDSNGNTTRRVWGAKDYYEMALLAGYNISDVIIFNYFCNLVFYKRDWYIDLSSGAPNHFKPINELTEPDINFFTDDEIKDSEPYKALGIDERKDSYNSGYNLQTGDGFWEGLESFGEYTDETTGEKKYKQLF